MAPDFARTIPILRVFSVEKAKEYYAQFLGFKVDWEHQLDPEAPPAWNTNVMRVTDPFGNRIVFNEADCARGSAVASK